ncbi:MAG: endonuclease/exonuclease/phosphatase family protein [Gammaproteobacteria bacterium]
MLKILASLTLLTVLCSLLPMLRASHWLIRGLDFPRLQIATFSATLLMAHFAFLDISTTFSQTLILATVACLLWQSWWVLPYTILWPKEVARATNVNNPGQLSLLTCNVLTPNRNGAALIALVNKHQPDILVTLESDSWWQEQLEEVERDMPYSVKCPQDNFYGMHVYSRLPLSDEQVCYLVENDVPSIHASFALPSGDKVRAHFLHPAPPSPTENVESKQRDAELIVVARSVADADQPVIVAGDLNDVAWSATTRLFRKISGLRDPRVGRGIYNTFHVDFPFMRWPLDHVFHSSHFELREIRRLPSIGSDHFPLLARLVISADEPDAPGPMRASSADVKRAKEMSAEEDVSKADVPKPGEDK